MTTIGNKFLQRITEARSAGGSKDTDTVKDGFSIPLDTQQKAIASRLKRPIEKKLVAMHAMAGVPGRYLNTEDIEDRIAAAADELRGQISIRRQFDKFYAALATAKGYSISEPVSEPVSEAAGSKMRGGFIQKLLESVLVRLGLPESLAKTDGPGAVGNALLKTAKTIEQDSNLEQTLRQLAVKMGIKANDTLAEGEEVDDKYKGPVEAYGVKGVKSVQWKKKFKSMAAFEKWAEDNDGDIEVYGMRKAMNENVEDVYEALDVGTDEFASAVVNLIADLGIPDQILQMRKAQVIKALREKKMNQMNRAEILRKIQILRDALAKGVRKNNQPAAPEAE